MDHVLSNVPRYFALIDPQDEHAQLGPALYYFGSEQLMHRMIDLGEKTQKVRPTRCNGFKLRAPLSADGFGFHIAGPTLF